MTGATISARAQSNLPPPRLTLQTAVPEERRLWSTDVHQLFRPPQSVDDATTTRAGDIARAISAAATNGTVVLQDKWSQSQAERIERLVERMDERGFGIVRPQARNRTAIDRGIEAVFAPELIRAGRTQIAFSPYTAIKRRNPLCLLNPIPFSLSW